jgi:hypothetical protein
MRLSDVPCCNAAIGRGLQSGNQAHGFTIVKARVDVSRPSFTQFTKPFSCGTTPLALGGLRRQRNRLTV